MCWVAAAVVCAPHDPVLAQSAASVERGNDIFKRACASCHGADGRGMPQRIVGFDTELPDFTDCVFSSPEADADWHTIIEYGGPVRRFDRRMPAFRDALTSDEIDDVIGYLRQFCRDRRWPRGDLNLPRPLITEKAFPENEALLTMAYDRGEGASISSAVVYEHRIAARGQYELVLPFNLHRPQNGGYWNSGLGDVAVAYKHVLFDRIATGSILSAGGEVSVPTGNESSGLGSGVARLEPFVAFGQILGTDGFLHAQSGFEASTDHNRADDEAFVKTALGRSFAERNGGRIWSPMIELAAIRELGAGRSIEWSTAPQVQVTLSRRQHIVVDVGVEIPINERKERQARVLFYFLWDWFDGGLFEGW
jgi:mono/diheme cytochrome c family protein